MKTLPLPPPDVWDRMTAEEQWDFMRLSAMCAKQRRERQARRERRWSWIARLFRGVAHSLRA
jgi:hypothetical protein